MQNVTKCINTHMQTNLHIINSSNDKTTKEELKLKY